MSFRVMFKGVLKSKTVNFEYFNNLILFFRNKVSREIIQIASEYELFLIEYEIQTQTGDKNVYLFYNLKTDFAQTNENSIFTCTCIDCLL